VQHFPDSKLEKEQWRRKNGDSPRMTNARFYKLSHVTQKWFSLTHKIPRSRIYEWHALIPGFARNESDAPAKAKGKKPFQSRLWFESGSFQRVV
jgi:hypothetical protein